MAENGSQSYLGSMFGFAILEIKVYLIFFAFFLAEKIREKKIRRKYCNYYIIM
jgi:hypothetical protein